MCRSRFSFDKNTGTWVGGSLVDKLFPLIINHSMILTKQNAKKGKLKSSKVFVLCCTQFLMMTLYMVQLPQRPSVLLKSTLCRACICKTLWIFKGFSSSRALEPSSSLLTAWPAVVGHQMLSVTLACCVCVRFTPIAKPSFKEIVFYVCCRCVCGWIVNPPPCCDHGFEQHFVYIHTHICL